MKKHFYEVAKGRLRNNREDSIEINFYSYADPTSDYCSPCAKMEIDFCEDEFYISSFEIGVSHFTIGNEIIGIIKCLMDESFLYLNEFGKLLRIINKYFNYGPTQDFLEWYRNERGFEYVRSKEEEIININYFISKRKKKIYKQADEVTE